MRPFIPFLLVIGIWLIMTKSTGDATVARGIRNNNPLNIRENENVDYEWIGEHEQDLDPQFEEFESPEYGIRAAARLLNTYRTKHGLNTINGIISRWAPRSENETDSYIASVAQKVGIDANEPLPLDQIPALIKAMIYHENGSQPYSDEIIIKGVAMA
ncbi:hypothetical protein [Shewanella psychrotolerans]|uniref:hypothetical protein n=1 Tax=Shewanella psychrotolerans TaxID=2864206 RepID=UPI001C65DB69|nr:hypothetical protein [Shewanella psychrotolerans]QYK03124.1 hypothetical protein K0I62_09490 [Shewanella psychrotolerans]